MDYKIHFLVLENHKTKDNGNKRGIQMKVLLNEELLAAQDGYGKVDDNIRAVARAQYRQTIKDVIELLSRLKMDRLTGVMDYLKQLAEDYGNTD